MNDILLHFIGNEKWWHLSRVMTVYHDLLCHESLRKEFKACFNGKEAANSQSTKSKKLDFAMNIKYGIYSFMIWICYHHQFTPKPVITFFEEQHSDSKQEGDTPDGDSTVHSKNTKNSKDGADEKVFETLESVKERVIELSIAKSVMIQLLVTMVCELCSMFTVLDVASFCFKVFGNFTFCDSINLKDEWLMVTMMTDFDHIRDRLVILKLLQTLLHDVEFLENQHVLDPDEQYKARFIRIFHRFKQKLTVHSQSKGAKEDSLSAVMSKESDSLTLQSSTAMTKLNALKRMAGTTMKSKIIFRKQAISKRVKVRNVIPKPQRTLTTNQSGTTNQNGKTTTKSFEHFTEKSMKIVDCIINGKQDLLAQFVTRSPTKLPAKKLRKTVEVVAAKKRKNAMPPPPVFEPFKGGATDRVIASVSNSNSNPNPKFISNSDVNPRKRKATESILDLSGSPNGATQNEADTAPDIVPSTDFEDDIPLNPYAPTVPPPSNDTVTPHDPYSNVQGQNGRNMHHQRWQNAQQRHSQHSQQSQQPFRSADHGDDFSFDFGRLSNRSAQRKRNFVSMQTTDRMQSGYGYGDGFNGNYYGQQSQQYANPMGYPPSNPNPLNQSATQFEGVGSPPKKAKTADNSDSNAAVGDAQLSDLLGFFS